MKNNRTIYLSLSVPLRKFANEYSVIQAQLVIKKTLGGYFMTNLAKTQIIP